MKKVIKLALSGIGIGVLVLVLKYAAYHLTGSVALYSDALESIVNVATALTAFFAVRLSARPPDSNHPYGHHKAEYLSAVLEGVLIVVAAIAILQKAYFAYLDPRLDRSATSWSRDQWRRDGHQWRLVCGAVPGRP